jgi:hypothetical protein
MKVGLINFTYTYNYGAVLQCLGLYKVLEAAGHEVHVINYIPEKYGSPSILQGWGFRSGASLRKIQSRLIALRYGAQTRNRFDEFKHDTMTYSPVCRSAEEVQNVALDFDALVVGSDQVWNPFFYDDPVFFMGFDFEGRRVSYAACSGYTPDEAKMKENEDLPGWLRKFDHISVRNDFTKKVIDHISGRDSLICADPTLLVEYKKEEKPLPKKWAEKKYIAAYILGDAIHGGHEAAVAKIREKVGDLPVVAIASSAHKPCAYPWADHVVWAAGPGEWLSWIGSSVFLYTDSFHGTIFAMKSEVPFVAYYREEERADRILDLASRYNVENFVVNHTDKIFGESGQLAPDYNKTNQLVRDHAEQSMKYLQNALGRESIGTDV